MNFAGITFKKEKTEKLDGVVYTTWTEVTDRANPFKVEASKKGVRFLGEMASEIFGEKDLNNFAAAVAEAWKEHNSLKATIIMQSPTGH